MLTTFRDFFLREVREPVKNANKILRDNFSTAIENLRRSFFGQLPNNVLTTLQGRFNQLQYDEERKALITLINTFSMYRVRMNTSETDTKKCSDILQNLTRANIPIDTAALLKAYNELNNNNALLKRDVTQTTEKQENLLRELVNIGALLTNIFTDDLKLNKIVSKLVLQNNKNFDLGHSSAGHAETHGNIKQKVVQNEIDFIKNICDLNLSDGYMLGVVGNGAGLEDHTNQALRLGFNKSDVTYFEIDPQYYINIVNHHPTIQPAVTHGTRPQTFSIDPQLLPDSVKIGPGGDYFICDDEVSLVYGDLTRGYPPAFDITNDQVTFIDFDITAGINSSGAPLGNESKHAQGVLDNANTFIDIFPNVKAIVQVFEFQRTLEYKDVEFSKVLNYFKTNYPQMFFHRINTITEFEKMLRLNRGDFQAVLSFLAYLDESRALGVARTYANIFKNSEFDVFIQPYYGSRNVNMISFTLCRTNNTDKQFYVNGLNLSRTTEDITNIREIARRLLTDNTIEAQTVGQRLQGLIDNASTNYVI